MKPRLGTVCVAFVSALAPRIAWSQDAGACSPACQSGEICVGGTCMVPACRPPCAAGETCVGGACMVPVAAPPAQEAPLPPAAPVPAPAPPSVTPPPAPAVRPVTRANDSPSQRPTVRRGAYGIAQVGVSTFQEAAARFLSPGLRVGGLAGGYVTNNISLGGGLTFNLLNWDLGPGNDASGFMLEVAFAPLLHVGNARAELIVGPALGAWVRSTDRTDDLGAKFTGSGQGWALGGNVGVLVPVRRNLRVGAIFNVMFRETVHTCGSLNGVSQCASNAPTHNVIGGTIAVMR